MTKIVSKINVEHIKGNGEFHLYTSWAHNSRKFFKKLQIYMWPMFTHVCLCVNYG